MAVECKGVFLGKIRYHDFKNCQFWTLDGIFEVNHIPLICLGVSGFEFRAFLVCESLASESRVSGELTLAIIDVFGL